MNVNWTHCGVHFAIYTNIKSLHRLPETNIMLFQLCFNLKKKKKSKQGEGKNEYQLTKVKTNSN